MKQDQEPYLRMAQSYLRNARYYIEQLPDAPVRMDILHSIDLASLDIRVFAKELEVELRDTMKT